LILPNPEQRRRVMCTDVGDGGGAGTTGRRTRMTRRVKAMVIGGGRTSPAVILSPSHLVFSSLMYLGLSLSADVTMGGE
jgi:hypothetical protein